MGGKKCAKMELDTHFYQWETVLQNANIYLNCDNEDNVSNVFIASRGEEEKHRKADQLQNHQENKHLL